MCTRQTFCSPRSVAASLPGAQPPHLVNPHADLPAAPVPHLQPTGVRPSASGQPDRVGAGGLAVPRATNKSLSKTRHSGGPGWTPTTPLALTSGWSPGRKPVAGVCSATTPSSMKPPATAQWIAARSIDDRRSTRLLTPRNPASKWRQPRSRRQPSPAIRGQPPVSVSVSFTSVRRRSPATAPVMFGQVADSGGLW